MDGKVGFGVVGLGMGMHHCRTIMQKDNAKLVGVADISEEKGRQAESAFGVPWFKDVEGLLEVPDLDVVFVAVPSGLHAEVGMKAAQAGKHVLCEKPLEITLDKADALIRACDEAGVLLGVNFPNRYKPEVLKVKRALDDGLFGNLLFCESRQKWYRTQAYYDAGGWRGTWAMDGGGALMNQAIHSIDLLQWFGGEITEVTGHIAVVGHRIETEDLGMGIVKFSRGARGMILGTTVAYPGFDSVIELNGDRGTVCLRDYEIDSVHIKGTDDGRALLDGIEVDDMPADAVDDMVRAIQTGGSPLVDGPEGRKAVELILAIYASSQRRRPVNMKEEWTFVPPATA